MLSPQGKHVDLGLVLFSLAKKEQKIKTRSQVTNLRQNPCQNQTDFWDLQRVRKSKTHFRSHPSYFFAILEGERKRLDVWRRKRDIQAQTGTVLQTLIHSCRFQHSVTFRFQNSVSKRGKNSPEGNIVKDLNRRLTHTHAFSTFKPKMHK